MEELSRMSTIILHDKKNNNWSSLGIGPLSDAINPLVQRERNGIYDLSFKYPVNAPLFKELKVGRWVVTDAGPTIQAQSQRFEISQITKPINGIVTVYCEHYRYQLLRSIVKLGPVFKNISAQTALNQLQDRMEPKGDFTFFSDISTTSSIDFTDPAKFANAQEVLGGVRGSVLDNFGGEYVFNNNQVRLIAQAGKDTSIVIAYGKNLTDISQEESIENTYTSVYGWAKVGNGDDEKIITLPETYIDSSYVNNYTQRRIQMVDFSEKEPRDVESLRNLVDRYIKDNKVGIPKVSIKTSFVDLASSVIKDDISNIESIDLCDWVTVAFNELEINTSAQIVKTVWNVTLDTYESVELGEARTDFSKVLVDSQLDTAPIVKKVDWLEQAQKEATDIIKNPGEGHVVIYPSLADPQELLIMDTTNINTAQKVWRWNVGGLGFSSTGYNGTYGLAMTNNGAIVADRMTTGTLRAINIMGVAITGSSILSTNSNTDIFLNDGQLHFIDKMNGRTAAIIDTYANGANSIMRIGASKNGNTYKGQFNFASYFANLNVDSYDNNYDSTVGVGSGVGTNRNGYAYVGNNRKRDSDFSGLQAIGENIFLQAKSLQLIATSDITVFKDIDMNGNRIVNQSDIRLKENITPSVVDGISETKKLEFYEFNRRQNYKYSDENRQPPKTRELGLIAQYSPFLLLESSKDHYLGIDVNKQIMLNSLTNKQLIEKIEQLEKQLNCSKKNKRKYRRGGVR